ncbi:hypothetical protein AB0A76_32785 [Streptomyces exfoliatus]|uniref:Uncharacterized protein n=1 Tax=Streptomyces exfoliatus TaxID=1905 RepID=A0ABV3D615_STREX
MRLEEVLVGEDHGLDGVLLVLPGDEPVPVLASGGWPADPDLGAVDDAGLPTGAEVVDDFGQCSQPDAGADHASPLGEQGPYFADGPGDGGAVDHPGLDVSPLTVHELVRACCESGVVSRR